MTIVVEQEVDMALIPRDFELRGYPTAAGAQILRA